jgi:iron(III) transport system ATP-binding protein
MGEANVLPCEVVQSEAGEVLVRVSTLEHRLRSGAGRGPAKLAVRPGAIRISAAGAEGLRGRVLHSAYLGGHVEYEIETDIGTLFVVDHDVDHAHAAASDVTLALKSRGIAVISG